MSSHRTPQLKHVAHGGCFCLVTLTDGLQVHLLKLSNLDVTSQNVSHASEIRQWVYFMLNADKLSLEDVRRIFPDREFTEAAGMLEIISKTPEQQTRYDARLKI